MLLWPAVAGVGFLVLTGLVIVLGTATTARYEFEQNRSADQLPGAEQEAGQPQAGSRPAATLPFSNCTVIAVDPSADQNGRWPDRRGRHGAPLINAAAGSANSP